VMKMKTKELKKNINKRFRKEGIFLMRNIAIEETIKKILERLKNYRDHNKHYKEDAETVREEGKKVTVTEEYWEGRYDANNTLIEWLEKKEPPITSRVKRDEE